ncbi:MAG: pilus assembly protein N-terminal domain-containing protein [Thiotrichales bacterium]|nr:pilus assembly protein N-terminal domain-containing protein [Thiotrichales bacterium]
MKKIITVKSSSFFSRALFALALLPPLAILGANTVYAAQAVNPNALNFSVNQSESTVLNLKKPIKRVMVANPEIASLQVVSGNELLLSGKTVGKTELFITFRDQPNKSVRYLVEVQENPQQKAQIDKTLKELLGKLNPAGTVQYEIRRVWVEANSNLRRQVDEVGNQIDGEGQLSNSARQDQEVLQTQQSVGSSSVSGTAGNYMVLLTGEVPNQAQKKRIQSVVSALGVSVVNMIKISGPQEVKLEVRVAEVVKGNPFQSGFIFGNRNTRSGILPPGSDTSGNYLLNLMSSITSLNVPLAGQAFQLGINRSGSNMFGVLSVLEGNNLARVLARPELIVQSGETAEFLVGGEVPIPVSQNENAVTVQYKEFGVRLRFSPVITESGEIQMTVAPEISNIDFSAGAESGGLVQPGFRSRRAKTTVTLQPGQSFVIGGLIQDSIQSSVSKIPLLGDIPVLGALFRSTNFEKDQTELAILVTPTFVEPIQDGDKIILPGENMRAPSVSDGFWMGKVVEMLPENQRAIPAISSKIGLETP